MCLEVIFAMPEPDLSRMQYALCPICNKPMVFSAPTETGGRIYEGCGPKCDDPNIIPKGAILHGISEGQLFVYLPKT